MYMVPVITIQQQKYCLLQSFRYLTLLAKICTYYRKNETSILASNRAKLPFSLQMQIRMKSLLYPW